MKIIRNLFKQKENRYNYSVTVGNTGVYIEEDRPIKVGYNAMLEIPAVYSAIELIVNTVSSLDIKLYSEDLTGVEEVKTDKRIYCFNDEPNILMTGVELKKAIVRDYLIFGNAYVYIEKKGVDISLKYVPATKVTYSINESDPINPQIILYVGGKAYYPHEFIILTKNTRLGVIGRGVLHECQELLTLAHTQNKFVLSTLVNGGIKRGVLKVEHKLRKEELDDLKRNFEDVYAGRRNTIILNNGTNYQELQQSVQEMELVNLKSTITKEILTVFDIPENLFNSNIPTEIWQIFIKSTITPILTKIEQALNKSLLNTDEKGKLYFAFDTKQLMKGDIIKRFQAYKIAIENGFMTRNEVRFEEDLRELKGLDTVTYSIGETLLNPENGDIYTPNTGEKTNINDLGGGKNATNGDTQ